MTAFVRVGTVGDFQDGRLYAFTVEGKSVAVVRSKSRFYAFRNACTHAGYTLTPGHLQTDGSVYCPVHGAAFSLSGEAIAGPADDRLDLYTVRIEGEEVLLSESPDPL